MSAERKPIRPDDDVYARMLVILERLVDFDTTSDKSNLDLIGYVTELLAGNGIESRLHWNDDRSKANLVATAGPSGGDRLGILWSGHTDVVPVRGQNWSADPFQLRLTDDLAVGRGTADMKGFIACCLALLTAVDQDAMAVPVTLVLTYEEEVGCVGARRLVEEMRTWTDRSIGCVVGEPTGMRLVVGHKGKQNHRVRFSGEPRHAALAPESANPVGSAAELVTFAQSLNERFQTEGPRDPRFAIDHSWINVGRIDGGVTSNIVPDSCVVELEVRAIPGHDCDDIVAELRRYAEHKVMPKARDKTPTAGVSIEQLSDTPSFAMPPEHAFVDLLRSAFGEEGEPEYVPFGTEAGLFWGHAGMPTVVCGPGSIDQAHTPDESVPLEQLGLCLTRLTSLILPRPETR